MSTPEHDNLLVTGVKTAMCSQKFAPSGLQKKKKKMLVYLCALQRLLSIFKWEGGAKGPNKEHNNMFGKPYFRCSQTSSFSPSEASSLFVMTGNLLRPEMRAETKELHNYKTPSRRQIPWQMMSVTVAFDISVGKQTITQPARQSSKFIGSVLFVLRARHDKWGSDCLGKNK